MKKLCSLLLVLCVAAMSMMFGCSKTTAASSAGESTESQSGESSTVSVSPTDTTTTTTTGSQVVEDLNGYEFIIAMAVYNDVQQIELGVSDYIDAVYQRNKSIEAAYNCKITYEYYEPTTIFDSARAAIMSGDKFADVIDSQLFSFGSLYVNSLLYNLEDLPGLDLTSDAWISEYTEKSTFSDGVYGVAGTGLTPSSQIGDAVHYNKTLLEKLNLEDPATLVKNGQWTWDKFREMMVAAKKDLNNDGAWTAADRWGCTSAAYDGLVPFFFSSGSQAFAKSSDGSITYGLDNTEAASAFLKFAELFSSGDGAFYAADHDHLTQRAQYTSGKCLFFLSAAYDELEDMEDEDAVVPIPQYSSGSSYVSGVGHNALILSVPKTITDPDKTGLLLQALGEAAIPEYEIYLDTELGSYFRSDSSLEMIKNYIAPSVYLDLMMFVKNNDITIYNATECTIGNPIWYNACKASDMVGGFGQAAQAIIDEMFNNR